MCHACIFHTFVAKIALKREYFDNSTNIIFAIFASAWATYLLKLPIITVYAVYAHK